jgi:hypothetical protein
VAEFLTTKIPEEPFFNTYDFILIDYEQSIAPKKLPLFHGFDVCRCGDRAPGTESKRFLPVQR